MTRRTAVEIGISAVALAAATIVALLVLDLRTVDRTLANDDARFEGGSVAQTLWTTPTSLPSSWSAALLGARDDLRYRRTLLTFFDSAPGVTTFAPRLDRKRAEAQQALLALSRADSNRERRSEALNLLGVLAFPSGGGRPLDSVERQQRLGAAIGLFQDAVTIDPADADAKANLELALRDEGATQLPGTAPTGSPAGGAGVGTGRAGGGY